MCVEYIDSLAGGTNSLRRTYTHVQGESGEEGNILGDDSMSHCKRKIFIHGYYFQ